MSSVVFETLLADIKILMKNREADKLVALRSLHAQIKDVTTNAGREVTDEDVAAVAAKAIKQRTDAIEQYRAGNRTDLADKEQLEIDLIKKYLPQQLDRSAIEELVRKCIAETGAAGKKDMGKVMQALMPQVKGKADGKMVSQVVQELL
ncbi:MAG: GatB/YqeY domain-containing protein [Lentisphaerota bacterium]